MQIKLFTIPITDEGAMQTELNRFVASHRVLKTEQHFYQTNNGAAWCFCVGYLPSDGNPPAVTRHQTKKTDYKELLSGKEFEIFSALRSIRKELAIADAVPAYAVFTDAELAEMSRLNELTSQNVQKIEGIAEKRMNKYGVSLIEKYRKSTENEKVQPSDTTNSGNG